MPHGHNFMFLKKHLSHKPGGDILVLKALHWSCKYCRCNRR